MNSKETSYFIYIPHITMFMSLYELITYLLINEEKKYIILFLFVFLISIFTLPLSKYISRIIGRYFYVIGMLITCIFLGLTECMTIKTSIFFILSYFYITTLSIFSIKAPFNLFFIAILSIPFAQKIIFLNSFLILEKVALIIFISISIFTMFDAKYRLTKLNNFKINSVRQNHRTTLRLLGKVSELNDTETNSHLQRVEIIIDILVQRLKQHKKFKKILIEQYCEDIKSAAYLHDIGKIGIKDSILNKDKKLTSEEFEIMKTHTIIGYNIIKEAKKNLEDEGLYDIALEIVRHHHERWDGNGYPDSISKEEIPLSARIMSIVDVYDALLSERPYKKAFTHNEAILIMKKSVGLQFDPIISEVFFKYSHEVERALKKHFIS